MDFPMVKKGGCKPLTPGAPNVTTLAELRKYYSMLKDISAKCRTIMGGLPSELETSLEDVGRELVTLEGFDRDAKRS